MKNLKEIFERYKHSTYTLTKEENEQLRAFIEKKETRYSSDADIAIKLYAYSNSRSFSKTDVALLEGYLEPSVNDDARKAALWSLVLIWKIYYDYDEIIMSVLTLKYTDSDYCLGFRSAVALAISEISFESNNKKIRKFVIEYSKLFLSNYKNLTEEELFEYKYFIECLHNKYFYKLNNRYPHIKINLEEMIYYSKNIEKLLDLDHKIQL